VSTTVICCRCEHEWPGPADARCPRCGFDPALDEHVVRLNVKVTPGQFRVLEALYVNPHGCVERVKTYSQFGHVNMKAVNALVGAGLAEWRTVEHKRTAYDDGVRYFITPAGREALGKEAKRLNVWDVYEWTAEPRTARWIGTVDGGHQPEALRNAVARWPDLGKQTAEYASGRLILRRAGDTRGMPCDVVRP
jgi:hypothetical protein